MDISAISNTSIAVKAVASHIGNPSLRESTESAPPQTEPTNKSSKLVQIVVNKTVVVDKKSSAADFNPDFAWDDNYANPSYQWGPKLTKAEWERAMKAVFALENKQSGPQFPDGHGNVDGFHPAQFATNFAVYAVSDINKGLKAAGKPPLKLEDIDKMVEDLAKAVADPSLGRTPNDRAEAFTQNYIATH